MNELSRRIYILFDVGLNEFHGNALLSERADCQQSKTNCLVIRLEASSVSKSFPNFRLDRQTYESMDGNALQFRVLGVLFSAATQKRTLSKKYFEEGTLLIEHSRQSLAPDLNQTLNSPLNRHLN